MRALDLLAGWDGMPRLAEPIYFVAQHLRRGWPELASDPDSVTDLSGIHPVRWGPGENIWIISSYLRLKQHGLNVKIVDRLVPDAINVCYLDHLIQQGGSERAFVVVAQGDRCYRRWGEFTLAQSPEMARRKDSCLIDMWPQPGLTPRNPARGTMIRRMGYTGCPGNLARRFRTDECRARLEKLGVELVFRDEPEQWHDFGDLDLHLAVRDAPWAWLRGKPSTKLIHSWLTQCPAVLGPEPSYQYWGEDGADYFEVDQVDDLVRVVQKLQDDPALYQSVQERGHLNVIGHDEEGVCRQWAAALAGPVMGAFCRWRERSSFLRAGRRLGQKLTVPLSRKTYFLRGRGISAAFRQLKQS